MSKSHMTEALPPHSDGVNVCLAELLQYKNQAVRWLPPANSIWSQLNGQHQSRHKGRGMNFSEVRPYQTSDDIRSIDWRVTARTGKTHTKLFTEEREQPIMLFIDLSRSMQFGSQLMLKSVQTAHFASLLSWLAINKQDRVGAVIYNGIEISECKPTARQQGPLHIMNSIIKSQQVALHSLDKPQSSHFSDALKRLHYLCAKGSEIIMTSDFNQLEANDHPRLSQLRQHNRIQFVQVHDPLEQGQTPFRGYEHVADKKQSLWLNFSSAKTRESLQQQYESHQNFLTDITKSLAIPLHYLSAAEPLLHQLKTRTKGVK
jgi:uncharacterized protein (DUF58 family)